MTTKDDLEELKHRMWGSFLLFTQTFFPLVTGRPFSLSKPISRESHFITISREFTLVARLSTKSLNINTPPGSAKSTLAAMFVAWTLSRWNDSQYLYISYGHELAAKHTEMIRRIIQCSDYKTLFGIEIRHDMKAKDHFMTTAGGSVKAFGSSGPITGHDAGKPHCDRFSGCVIIDDAHKPDEVHSDTIRQGVIKNYRETILQRPRGPNVPIIYIGQRLHEDDLPAYLMSGEDERVWKSVILKSIDDAGNALYPEVNPLEQLKEKQEKNPYVFASQYQQNPIPAGGALYKEKYFVLLPEEPDFLCTFITADTAETSKTHNDATAFSFWGVYKLSTHGQEIETLALHWIDAVEIRVEPKDLRSEFISFYDDCMRHKTKPLVAAIEKKSTGVTLCSVLEDMRGLQIREVKRTVASGSKAQRFLEMQPYIASKLISFTEGARHKDVCVSHLLKITPSGVHRHDDLADTLYDAIKIALIDKSLYNPQYDRSAKIVKGMADQFNQRMHVSRKAQNSWQR